MSLGPSQMVCAGCGDALDGDVPLPFACPSQTSADDFDHVLSASIELEGVSFPEIGAANPFIRYRELFHSYRLARRSGMSDDDYQALVRELDRAVAEVDGVGFRETPYLRVDEFGVSIKDETGQVGGSHKARHLMGIAIHLEIVERLGLVEGLRASPLAIASCGNAALAAAVLARALGRRLQVFVPQWASKAVVARLDSLGAERIVCERDPADPPGDPCYLRFREAVAAGALPFSCQGRDNGLTIAGGMPLAWELVSQQARSRRGAIDRLFIQVGGGALASSIVQGLAIARSLGALAEMPRIHAVQTFGGHPLERAWVRLRERAERSSIAEALAYARSHRSEFMTPWPEEPVSIASGILDDETYDWLAIVGAILETDGSVLLASEETLAEARDLGQQIAEISVDATGAAGFAGVLTLRRQGEITTDEEVAVLFTGVSR